MGSGNRIGQLAAKDRLRVVGLMSGTSADGVDAAIIDTDGQSVRLLGFETYPYAAALRKSIFELTEPRSARLDDICHYNFVLGEVFAEAAAKLCEKCGIALGSIDLIGSHGQTIYHGPRGRRFGRKTVTSTLQIGEPSVIAQRTGVTTVADFRPRDMAAGGEGAPLVPYADYILFNDKRLCRAIQNIGGIANVTYLPPCARTRDIIAFDTGPGNVVIDRAVELATGGRKRYDRGGRMAARGEVDRTLLGKMLDHPFVGRRPPKSTGREEFSRAYTDKLFHRVVKRGLDGVDIAATVTAFTAVTIARAYEQFLPGIPDEMILCGGGAHNDTLVRMLQEELAGVRIRRMDEFGISIDAKEAVSFAILAYATIKAIPSNIPGATGAEQPVVLGKIVPA